MEFLRKNYKTVVGSLIILILIEAVIVWYLLQQFHTQYMRGPEALAIALEDAGLGEAAGEDAEITLGHKNGDAWYNIRFEEDGTVYVYEVDAQTGTIRSSGTE